MNITRDVGSGLKVGKAVVGDSVDLVGNSVGVNVGDIVGLEMGKLVSAIVGDSVSDSVGVNVGDLVGLLVGLNVRRGFLVGTLDGG